MPRTVKALAADGPKTPLKPFEFSLPDVGDEHVEIAVDYCGICHSDLSMLHNEWGFTRYPFVPGHEVAGRITAVGKRVTRRKVGDRVGLGWYTQSCMSCTQCLSGDHNLCATAEQTIVGRHGGFGTHIQCHWAWATPLPDSLDSASAGPLFCGGITVFNPIVQFGIQPTDRVGVVGIGGLGHMAVKFLNKWGCEVTAFTSSESKKDEALAMGAHRVVNSRDDKQLASIKGQLAMILSTVNVTLNWNALLDALAPKGRLHLVGAVLEPLPIGAFSLIMGQKQVSGSPLGSQITTQKMIDFAARHAISPTVEVFPMSQVNEAIAHLEAGKARYRVVLKNDLA